MRAGPIAAPSPTTPALGQPVQVIRLDESRPHCGTPYSSTTSSLIDVIRLDALSVNLS